MSIEIKEVDILNNKKEREQFIDIVFDLYSKETNWVPPLRLAVADLLNKKHPFVDISKMKFWMALENGTPVGRVAAIINDKHNEFHNEKCGFFGFFEVKDNREDISKALLEVAEKHLKENGMDIIRGPMNPSTNYECGLLIEGFDDPPQIMMTYNKDFYSNHIESNGYTKAKDLLAYNLDFSKFTMPEKIVKVAGRIEKSSRVTYRPVNKKDWDNEVKLMQDIYNDAWEKNWGFVPMTDEEFLHTAKDLKSVVSEDLVLFAEVNGEAAGFIVALPDYNQIFKRIPNGKLLPFGILKLLRPKKYINRFRVITLGMRKKYMKLGISSLLYNKVYQNAIAGGQFKSVEMSWVLEDNLPMNKPLQLMGATPYKKYRIYQKDL